ncbi:MAG: glycoside hydrolase family 88 protein [Chitinophagaceae bacterium]|nr:glycoside hydrolase family 88 protein [Chitinophagaceae bacterium]
MKIITTLAFTVLCGVNSYAQQTLNMDSLIDANLKFAAKQYKLLEKNVPNNLMPRNFNPAKGKVETSDTKWWCSGFFPGTLWYIYEYTKDEQIKQIAEKRLSILEKEKHFTGNHDLGFMMFNSFGNAYRITGKPEYKEAVITAASSLTTRYRPAIQSIQSWDSNKVLKCPVIIDNMMNLELLYWASNNGGSSKFRDIAVTHANSTLKRHFRPDYSSYHVLDYDLNTGQIIKRVTWQGAADSSAWSRGQAWGLYGFTMMYRFSHNKTYLKQARNIANFLLNHPNLPSDKIPYWDFNAKGIPNAHRDASAGAIMASAFLELGQHVKKAERKKLVAAAEEIIRALSSSEYLSRPGECGGFLIKHNVGSMPHNSEVDVSLTYADYYYIEALLRYKNWYMGK